MGVEEEVENTDDPEAVGKDLDEQVHLGSGQSMAGASAVPVEGSADVEEEALGP